MNNIDIIKNFILRKYKNAKKIFFILSEPEYLEEIDERLDFPFISESRLLLYTYNRSDGFKSVTLPSKREYVYSMGEYVAIPNAYYSKEYGDMCLTGTCVLINTYSFENTSEIYLNVNIFNK